jgi:hypothetical protein
MSIKNIIVNGKNVEIFDNDTEKNIIERIASYLKIDPNFIKDDFKDFKDVKDGDKIIVNNLINDIKTYKYKTNIKKDVDFIENLIKEYKKVDQDTVIKLFFAANPFFAKPITDEIELVELIPLNEELKKRQIKLDTIKFLKKDEYESSSQKDIFIKKIKEKIEKLSESVNKLVYLNNELISINSIVDDIKDIKNLEIKKDECDLKLITNIKNTEYSLSTIFSKLICRKNTPFLSYNDIYKIYQDIDIKIPSDWSTSFSNFMILKVHIDNEKYFDCNIYFEDGSLIIIVEVKYKDFDYLTEEMTVQIIKNNINCAFSNFSDFSIISEIETNINENVLIPDQTFYTYVLSDIVMNHFIFSNFLSVNESVQTTKKKSGLYLHYFIKNTKGTCNITSVEDTSIIPFKNIVRLRIKKALNQDIADEFIFLIGKLLTTYKKEEKKIISFYRNYIPNFPKDKIKKETIEIPKITLQKQVPDLFISGYPYKCQYPPVIVSDEEAKEYPEERVMKYPIKGEGVPHNYVCKDDKKNEYVYIGLRENTLKNRDKYKYIPCCFKSDQTKRKGTYIEYFKGEVIEKGPQQNIIITNKLVKYDEYGVVPSNINKLLTTMDDSCTYLRKGVSHTNISFLDCVLEAVLDVSEYSAKSQKSKNRILHENLSLLEEYQFIGVASQENPGINDVQIRSSLKSLKNDNFIYMEPSKWIKLCETFYNCKIIIFSREINEKKAVITIPNHELVYLYENRKSDQKLVMIYEHYGTDIDRKFPMCELIVKWDKELSLEDGLSNYFFGKISKKIYNFYTTLLCQYYYSIFYKKLDSIPYFDLRELKFLKPSHQLIDNYGKARGVIINDFVLLSDPFPPIEAISIYKNDKNENDVYKENDLRSIMDFLNSNNIEILSQIVIDNTIKEINIKISNIIFTAKIKYNYKNTLIDQVKTDIIEKYPSINTDIQKNLYLKRLSYVISEYFVYYYSCYYNSQMDKDVPLLNSIKEFIKNKIKIKSSSYIIPDTPAVSLKILEENNFVFNNKFIVESKEILKRLLYNLHVKLENDYNNVINYHKNSEIYNFYKDTMHFSENISNIIVKDINHLEKIDNVIHNHIQPEEKRYFFNNQKLFSGNPILLSKEETKDQAFNVSSNWVKFGKFSDYEDDEPVENKIMYLYQSFDDIKIKKDIKNKKDPNSYVLKYKKEKEDNYMAIIQLV